MEPTNNLYNIWMIWRNK